MAKPKNNTTPKKTKAETLFMPGNNIWTARSKHGRDRIFDDPKTMWEAALEYAQFVKENPLQTIEIIGGKKVNVPKLQVMTMKGLCLFLDVHSQYFYEFKKRIDERLMADTKGQNEPEQFKKDTDFTFVIAQIEEGIFQHKFSAAAAGLVNANLISRDLGMMDKREINHKNDGKGFEPNNVVVFRIPDNNRPIVNVGKQETKDDQQ